MPEGKKARPKGRQLEVGPLDFYISVFQNIPKKYQVVFGDMDDHGEKGGLNKLGQVKK